MQGDKSAASRAIGQNRQLKRQLEELENAFIQLVRFFTPSRLLVYPIYYCLTAE